MGWLTMGALGEAPAVTEYRTCRERVPVEGTPAALTSTDPCWPQLVALRRYQGRDPLGRDVYGAGGPALYRDTALRPLKYAELERTGSVATTTEVAPAADEPVQDFSYPALREALLEEQEKLKKRARDLEVTRNGIAERRQRRQPQSFVKEWQVAAAALAIGLMLGKAWRSR